MGQILINIPDIPDSELVFDEDETRSILKFFWPTYASEIVNLAITNDVRRFAQTILIAAIDASYAMGFIQAFGEAAAQPGSGVKSLAKKLAKKFVKHWWKHTRQRNLEDVQIYLVVRDSIAQNVKSPFEMMMKGLAMRRGPTLVRAIISRVSRALA